MLARDLVIATIAAGCTIAAGVSAYTALAPKGSVLPETEFQPRVCERCGHAFRGPPEPVVTACPACTARAARAAVRACRITCSQCGAVYDSYYYRYRDVSLTKEDVARLRASGPEPELEYRSPGGEWGPYESLEGPTHCPRCGGLPRPTPP